MNDDVQGPVATELTKRLEAALAPSDMLLQNESHQHAGHAGHDGSGESHFAVTIVSDAFSGLNRLQRQRLVFQAVGDLMQQRVHALRIQAVAPGEA
ncbi:MAG: BolA family transcriptional regulator [Planctomycetes bacterium]|nr:BolA family transcriptional regulator [Planctomycetota bacterium]